ncbi:MAG: hypothetical protein U0989_06315, partial [Azonexus sp.]|nr:hypothetical protein [Azonexus sp.]
LPGQWNQSADQQVDPICRSQTGSITPIMTWILYADHQVDPLGRSLTLADRGQYLASESTFYRVLRAEAQCQHRGAERPAQKPHKPRAATMDTLNPIPRIRQ